MSFSLQAAFKIIQKPFSVLVIIKSSIIPPSLLSKKEYFEWLIFKFFRSAGIIFSRDSINVSSPSRKNYTCRFRKSED